MCVFREREAKEESFKETLRTDAEDVNDGGVSLTCPLRSLPLHLFHGLGTVPRVNG